MDRKQKRDLLQVAEYYVRTVGTLADFMVIFSSESDVDKRICSLLQSLGVTAALLDAHKDVINGFFDSSARAINGEFYTPLQWAAAAYEYFDTYIPTWRTDYVVWDASAGTGNLIRNANIAPDNLFMSTLLERDLPALQKIKGTAFQLDFLSTRDIVFENGVVGSRAFSELLPASLRSRLESNCPLIFFMNPPYFRGRVDGLGGEMASIGLGGASKELYYQFLYQVLLIIETYQLTNVWVGVFGLVSLNVGVSLRPFLRYFRERLSFVDGMLLPSDSFTDTSESVQWSIGFSLYKQGNQSDLFATYTLKRLEGDKLTVLGKETFDNTRDLLIDWMQCVSTSYVLRPLFTNPPAVCEGGSLGKYESRALGVMLVASRIGDALQRSAISTCPLTASVNVFIQESNFWRAVACHVVHRLTSTVSVWHRFVKSFYAPVLLSGQDIETDAEYLEWLHNALVVFLLGYKNLAVSLRPAQIAGVDLYISNPLFPLSRGHMRKLIEGQGLDVLLSDVDYVYTADGLSESVVTNDFVLQQIEVARVSWYPESVALWDFCIGLLSDMELRRTHLSEGQLQNWDAGWWQIRQILPAETVSEYQSLATALHMRLSEGLTKFYFL